MKDYVRLAVVGGSRGASFDKVLQSLASKVQLVAVCDSNEEVLNRWKADYPHVHAYIDYEKLLEDDQVDAVFLATPMLIHASQAIRALRAGKHVLSEVIAIHRLEDGDELIETVEKTGLTYMMAENYCYTRPNMMVRQMARAGLLGDLVHLEGGYIHDCRTLTHNPEGQLTWRGELIRDYNGNAYPTHSLGPIAQWLGINREDGDDFEELTTFVSKNAGGREYFKEVFGSEHPGAQDHFLTLGDSSMTLIRTKKGALITLRFDMQSARPHNMTHYALQGTKGAYMSSRYHGEDDLIWIDGLSPGKSPDGSAEWESLWNCAEDWEHPLWKELGDNALKSGHGGGDFFVLREFISAILEKRKPEIDVYDAVIWSSVFPLSMQSVASGGAPVKFPDYRARKKQ
ncbi:Gfo/Idh/MocA family protein [Paenibacillus nasutitermitis]|uniref:Alpha-N-acetylgalactosaminidase n=1 Tax=Paenibacillus nasutitermitis TaxID=1652958 RepID=A0A917DMP0_9BACL|nr:Gfo/Idh/MocA family oxidoreductase [Paenibacillus nasutitermitis]GGD53196.1 alpha-N-acetylgalactosaminidase [Paenibacillus nasutitermitis]